MKIVFVLSIKQEKNACTSVMFSQIQIILMIWLMNTDVVLIQNVELNIISRLVFKPMRPQLEDFIYDSQLAGMRLEWD